MTFQEIGMHFVAKLPESEDFNEILVVTGSFTKIGHYLPPTMTMQAVDVANTHINEIWRLHGQPLHITSE